MLNGSFLLRSFNNKSSGSDLIGTALRLCIAVLCCCNLVTFVLQSRAVGGWWRGIGRIYSYKLWFGLLGLRGTICTSICSKKRLCSLGRICGLMRYSSGGFPDPSWEFCMNGPTIKVQCACQLMRRYSWAFCDQIFHLTCHFWYQNLSRTSRTQIFPNIEWAILNSSHPWLYSS